MSVPLEPRALRIPISACLSLIEVEIKLENKIIAKAPKTPPTIKNILLSPPTKSSTELKASKV